MKLDNTLILCLNFLAMINRVVPKNNTLFLIRTPPPRLFYDKNDNFNIFNFPCENTSVIWEQRFLNIM